MRYQRSKADSPFLPFLPAPQRASRSSPSPRTRKVAKEELRLHSIYNMSSITAQRWQDLPLYRGLI